MIMTVEEDESQRYLGFNPDIKRGTLFEKCRYVFLLVIFLNLECNEITVQSKTPMISPKVQFEFR